MIDIADLKAWLGNPTEAGVDTLLTSLEARAVDLVQRETERYFGASESHTEILLGNGSTVLWLKERPSALTSVEERLGPGDAWVAVGENDEDGWELRTPSSDTAGKRLLRKNGHLWLPNYEYRIIYTFGYAAGDEPPEIRQAVIDLVALKYHERGREGLRSETIGDYSYTALADGVGKRDLYAVPGIARILLRWRGRTFA